MDDLYTNKNKICNLFQIAAVARCDGASLLPAEDKEGEEGEAALPAMAFLIRNTQNP